MICKDEYEIPIKQMSLKAKHEQLVYDQIQTNFSVGKPINVERKHLSMINENMDFEGGPSDKKYARKVLGKGPNKFEHGRRNALKIH